MARRSRLVALAAMAAGLVLPVASAIGQTTDTAAAISQMQQQIAQLQAKVNDLQAQEQQEHQEQVAAASQRSVADADAHSQLIPTGDLFSGYDPNVGFVLRSSDGQFTLIPGGNVDFREMTSTRQHIPHGDADLPAYTGDNTQSGFDATRVRLIFKGNYTKALDYYVQFQDDSGSTFGLYDAYATLHLGDSPFAIKFGQFKDPVYHERLVSDTALLAVDRSLLESFFGGGQTSRVQGIALTYDQDRARAQVAFTDGYNSINTKFYDVSSASTSPLASTLDNIAPDFGVSGRAEYLVLGDRTSDYNPFAKYDGGFTALGDKHGFLIVGSGFDYTEAGSNAGLQHTVDAQYDDPSGLSLYGAYLGSYRQIRNPNLTSNTAGLTSTTTGLAPVYSYGAEKGNWYDSGFMLQAGYLVTPNIEPFVRYDYTLLAAGSAVFPGAPHKVGTVTDIPPGKDLNDNSAQELTAGANYYMYGQHLKFTVDASWLPEGSPVDQDQLGILADNGHSEFVLRLQFQVAI